MHKIYWKLHYFLDNNMDKFAFIFRTEKQKVDLLQAALIRLSFKIVRLLLKFFVVFKDFVIFCIFGAIHVLAHAFVSKLAQFLEENYNRKLSLTIKPFLLDLECCMKNGRNSKQKCMQILIKYFRWYPRNTYA